MRESTPLSILLLFFAGIITLLVVETNRYHQQFLDNSDDRSSPQCEVTKAEMFAFWLWHYRWDIQYKAGWRTTGQKWNSLAVHSTYEWWYMLRIIIYYAFYISWTIIGMELTGQMKTVENTRLVWKYKDELLKILHPLRTFGSRWSNCEIQGKGSFQIVNPKKTQMFWHQMFNLCDSTGYTYDINVYLGKDKGWHNTWQQPMLQWLIWQGGRRIWP